MSPARARTSAGILPIHVGADGVVRVLIGHMGGPLWARKDERAWSIIKGEFDPETESPRQAAEREWAEETGLPVPQGDWFEMGTVKQSGGKVVHAFAVLVTEPFDVPAGAGNTVTTQWPPRSGTSITFPEIDRTQWCTLQEAGPRVVAAQKAFLERLELPQ